MLLHLAFGSGLNYFFHDPLIVKKPTIVDLLENNPKKQTLEERNAQQFVKKADLPDKFKIQEKKKAHYISAEDQYVLEETRAQANGETVNRSSDSNSQKTAQAAKAEEKAKPKKADDQKPAEKKTADKKPSKNLKAVDLSTFGDTQVSGLAPEHESEPKTTTRSRIRFKRIFCATRCLHDGSRRFHSRGNSPLRYQNRKHHRSQH